MPEVSEDKAGHVDMYDFCLFPDHDVTHSSIVPAMQAVLELAPS